MVVFFNIFFTYSAGRDVSVAFRIVPANDKRITSFVQSFRVNYLKHDFFKTAPNIDLITTVLYIYSVPENGYFIRIHVYISMLQMWPCVINICSVCSETFRIFDKQLLWNSRVVPECILIYRVHNWDICRIYLLRTSR